MKKQQILAMAQRKLDGKERSIYTRLNSKYGAKFIGRSVSPQLIMQDEHEMNMQVMARNRLKTIGLYVPKVYGVVYVRIVDKWKCERWEAYAIMDHIVNKKRLHERTRKKLYHRMAAIGFIHEDLHDENVFRQGRKLWVIDFGICKATWAKRLPRRLEGEVISKKQLQYYKSLKFMEFGDSAE